MVEPSDAHELSPIKRALLELRDLRVRLEETERRQHEPVAIIGMGLRFPGGADEAGSFWKLLQDGVDAIKEVPADRWDAYGLFDPDPDLPGKMSTRFGGFLEKIYDFDPHFFGISPREAETMDPQQRLLLEIVWEALENAAVSSEKLFGTQTGIFVGISNGDYYRQLLADPMAIDAYTTTSNAYSVAGGRLSYTLGLHGPNIAVDTACSSSLTAVHLAVQSLRRGECNLALAGGVNLILSPEISINFSRAHILSTDGRCKTFDAAADGYGRGEGCGMVVLKRLSEAQAAGDMILAVIRGSALNHDGRSGGLTAPNGPAQEAVIRAALEDGGVEPNQVGFVETHGTGTSLGDPIEVNALVAALAGGRSKDKPLMISSVKTNFGHLEAAAGIAGLIKTVLVLQHQEIPPHLNFTTLNPHIVLGNAPVVIPTERMPWRSTDQRVAGVSSFGLSGTNAHVILEEAPERMRQGKNARKGEANERPLHLLTLSAKSRSALNQLAEKTAQYLSSHETELADAAFTLNTGRSHFTNRLAVCAASADEASLKLRSFAAGSEPTGMASGTQAGGNQQDLAFLFTGHGAHYVNMGRMLYQTQPIFRETMEECDAWLRPILGDSLLAVLYPDLNPPPEKSANPARSLDNMTYTQPALFTLQIALARLWLSWGVKPVLMLGHSGGEYAAAVISGVLRLQDAVRLVSERGRLMTNAARGSMAAVFAAEAVVEEVIAPHVERISIAAFNGPANIVISGEETVLDGVLEKLQKQRIKFRKLAISQAAHSPMIDPLLDEFENMARTISFSEPQIGLVSSVSGNISAPGEMTQAIYWRRHLRQPVRFAPGMQTLYENGMRTFLEIGPNPVLIANGQRCIPTEGTMWLPSLRENLPDWEQLLETLGKLYIKGIEIDWEGFDRDHQREKAALPTYPFQRSYFRVDPKTALPGGHAEPKGSVWDSLTTAGNHQVEQGPLDLEAHRYPERWAALHHLTVAYICQTVKEMGIFAHPQERLTANELIGKYQIADIYQNLIKRWLIHLHGEGILQRAGEHFWAEKELPDLLGEAWEVANPWLADIPIIKNYVERCGERLTAVMTGAISALETLFPGGSFEQADALYQKWTVSRYFIEIMRALTAAFLSANPGRQIRVLELGAGTGATTSILLPVFPPQRTTFFFTDVSEIFLDRAAHKYVDYPFMRYGLLDIEKSPAEQGYVPHSFDLVVAANVLHATHNLDDTLEHVKQLLVPGGVLLVNEATTLLSWLDITTGLIGGWQRFADEWRTDQPLLPVKKWTEVLKKHGFERIVSWPEPGAITEALGQHVFAAQAADLVGKEAEAVTLSAQIGDRYSSSAGDTAEDKEKPGIIVQKLQLALPVERRELLIELTRQQVAKVLRLKDLSLVDIHQRLLDMGLDSLMALELRKELSTQLDLPESDLSATLVFDYPNVAAIAQYLEQEVLFMMENPTEETGLKDELAQKNRAAEIAGLSEEEAEAILLRKLKGLK